MLTKRTISAILVYAVCFFLVKPAKSQDKEYVLKAAFLYRFTDYIEWNSNEETFNIAVLGRSDIFEPLIEITKDQRVKDKKIVVKQYAAIQEMVSPQMIFVSRNYRSPAKTVVARYADKPVLIVTEQEADFNHGAHMNFLISGNKLRFEVDLKTVSGSGLKISSQLLQHALVVKR